MEKIKVIFTGGTIGSLAQDNDININSETQYLLLKKYAEKFNKDISRFDTIAPLNILSENARLCDIILMYKEIYKASKEDVKGIIVTHGTDTLAHSSAYLSLLLYKINKPVVLVSSNFVITNENANGIDNFNAAVELIDSENLQPNVYVSYKNPEDDYVSIHYASKINEPMPYSDSFFSPTGFRYAIYKNSTFIYENITNTKTNKIFKFSSSFKKCGLLINPYTGLNYDYYKNTNLNYVVHNLYHSGTANTQNYINDYFDSNFLNFADFCNVNKIPLYICNIKKKDVNYNSTNKILEKNVKILYNILPNLALAKLNIAYNLVDETEKEEFLNTNICGEILEN